MCGLSQFTVTKDGVAAGAAAGGAAAGGAAAGGAAAPATPPPANNGGAAAGGAAGTAAGAATGGAAAPATGAAGFALKNGQDAIALNKKFATLKNGDACTDTAPTCAGGTYSFLSTPTLVTNHETYMLIISSSQTPSASA
jgi:hypothetical protein